jgi:UDP-N-acetylmuramate: L-alanyl-gamma-D-glutamyl-meso-diaminopimelate ligase
MLDTEKLIEAISQNGKPAYALVGADEIVGHLLPQLEAGDVVAVMSNGGFGGIHEKLLSGLRAMDSKT